MGETAFIDTVVRTVQWFESIGTFFFLITTLSLAFHNKNERIPSIIKLLTATAIFSLIYKQVEYHGNFFIYVIALIIGAIAYIFIIDTRHLLNQITCCISYISWGLVAKGILAAALRFSGLASHSSIVLASDVAYYLTLTLLGFFMISHPLNTPQHFPKLYWVGMMAMPLIIAVTVSLNITFQSSHHAKSWLAVLMQVVLFMVELITYYLSYTLTQSHQKLADTSMINQRLELKMQQFNQQQRMVDEIRRDKHEMKNTYFYIHSLLKTEQYDELNAFVDKKLLQRYDEYEIFDTGNEFIDMLLSQRISEARHAGIHVMTSIQLPEKLPFEEMDLCGLLMNLLDNAIEASARTTQPDIHITMRPVKNYFSIEVKNKIDNHDIATITAAKIQRTTKHDKKSHGYGLRVVRSIVKKYDGMIDFSGDGGYFTVLAMLKL